ncbi:MAG: SCP2 sterol-binding domain-containing protein [Gammaproteobacteria bacterium]|nr:SCP2 sterol-binding domain-containing protein [Gammaproteobacteria bacterium]
MTIEPERLVTAAVGALLARDPGLRARLAALEGRVVAVVIERVEVTFYLLPRADGIDITRRCPTSPDLTISGRPAALLAMLRRRAGAVAPAGVAGGVQLRGDLEAAQVLQDVAARLGIDWEELLASVIGDVGAHQIGRGARALARWIAGARDALAADVADYLRYESGLLARQDEVDQYVDAVDLVRDDVERLEARLRRLESRRGNRGGAGP